jgi:hypothetical protein
MLSMNDLKLGGFREAADTLTGLSGRRYSRQGVQQLWKRRGTNGFPDLREISINGKPKRLFDMEDVADWYSYAECALWLTQQAGKLHTPSQVFHLWAERGTNHFPDREPFMGRLIFDPTEVKRWYKSREKNA